LSTALKDVKGQLDFGRVELEDVRFTVKQRDAYILKLQKDADAVRAELEQEKKQTEGKL
jgi:predicted transcriptional regulator